MNERTKLEKISFFLVPNEISTLTELRSFINLLPDKEHSGLIISRDKSKLMKIREFNEFLWQNFNGLPIIYGFENN